jgi:hypothetical protein
MKLKTWWSNLRNSKHEFADEISEVEKYFDDLNLKEFVNKYERLLKTKNSNHYFSTLGINFKNENVDTVKFYAHILEEMSDNEVLEFIPTTDDYNRFLPFKGNGDPFNPSNVGTVLEIKFRLGIESPTYGFFYLLQNIPESYNLLGYPEKLPDEVVKNGVSLGVNYEYNGVNTTFKKYYYYNRKEDIVYFQNRMGFPILGNFLEYAEGDEISKLNNYEGIISGFWQNDKNFSVKEKKIIKYLQTKYNFSIIGYGGYENSPIKAIYFREGKSKSNDLKNLLTQYSNIFGVAKKHKI